MTPPDYDDLCAKLRELYVQHGTNYVQAAADAIAALRADNAALRQDAERYRWLRETRDVILDDLPNAKEANEAWDNIELGAEFGYGDMDAAINAALLAGKKP